MHRIVLISVIGMVLGCNRDPATPFVTLNEGPTASHTRKGKRLFKESCSSCHDKSLTNPLTGPALYGVNKRRSRPWLLDWTKDGYNSISYGDSIALCLWEAWAPTIGCTYYANRHGEPGFAVPEIQEDVDDAVIDDELNAIYDWIEQKTAALGPIEVEQIRCDSAIRQTHPSESLAYIKLQSKGWAGIRRLDSNRMVQRLEITITPRIEERSVFNLSVVFPAEGFAVPLLKLGNTYIISGTQGTNRMPWTDNKVYLAGRRGGEEHGAIITEILDTKTTLQLSTSDFDTSWDELLAHKFKN